MDGHRFNRCTGYIPDIFDWWKLRAFFLSYECCPRDLNPVQEIPGGNKRTMFGLVPGAYSRDIRSGCHRNLFPRAVVLADASTPDRVGAKIPRLETDRQSVVPGPLLQMKHLISKSL